MTRKEQIQKLIDEENGIDNYGSSDYQVGVCDGVRLADKTMIDKACNWLEVQLDRFKLGDNKIKVDFVDKEKFINLFKKAIEE